MRFEDGHAMSDIYIQIVNLTKIKVKISAP